MLITSVQQLSLKMKLLPKQFFSGDTVTVAKNLLGKIIEVNGFRARIVETEAYGTDPASHAFKKTERSTLMHDTFGHVYVYLIYGMYNCINFTTDRDNPGAVLIRAVEPLHGIEEMRKNRRIEKGSRADKLTNFCSGPGKLCQALGIDRNLNGLQLGKEVKVYDDSSEVSDIGKSSRIGIKDALDLQWRFFLKSEFVSKV